MHDNGDMKLFSPEARRKWCRRALALYVAGTLVAGVLVLAAASRPLGDALEDLQRVGCTPFAELREADAIVILGGDEGTRALGAAKAFRAGLAPRVVVSADEDFLLDALAAAGVPDEAISVDPLARRTIDHPRTICLLPGVTPESRLIVTSSRLQERRAKFLFEKAGFRDVQIYSMDADRIAFQRRHPEKFSRAFWSFRRAAELGYAYAAWLKYFIVD